MKPNRRNFLTGAAAAAGGAFLSRLVPTAQAAESGMKATSTGATMPFVPPSDWKGYKPVITPNGLPRTLDVPLGTRGKIQAEVTDDEARRATDVYLQWSHDADDPMMVRISPLGSVFGNREGQTCVRASAGNPEQGGIWARIPVEVRVVPNEKTNRPGDGFPRLLVTDRDIDPETGDIRPGDPDRPSLNQEVSDNDYNIWWLNLAAPDAAFFSEQRDSNPQVWRGFHAQKLVEMVGQVRMREEYIERGDDERAEVWARHKAQLEEYQVELMAQMWQALQPYILTGRGLE